jgi:hypothetical protein
MGRSQWLTTWPCPINYWGFKTMAPYFTPWGKYSSNQTIWICVRNDSWSWMKYYYCGRFSLFFQFMWNRKTQSKVWPPYPVSPNVTLNLNKFYLNAWHTLHVAHIPLFLLIEPVSVYASLCRSNPPKSIIMLFIAIFDSLSANDRGHYFDKWVPVEYRWKHCPVRGYLNGIT